jgi:hypothetical protein
MCSIFPAQLIFLDFIAVVIFGEYRRYIVWDTEKASLNKLQTNKQYLVKSAVN